MRSLLVLPLLLAACGHDHAGGTITSTVYGEEFIEQGIPAAVFADGWSVNFDAFVVSIGNVRAEAGHDHEEVGIVDFFVVDLAQDSGGEGFALGTYDAPGGEYDHYGYQLQYDTAATGLNVSAEDLSTMKSSSAAIWVRGSATKGSVTKTFEWFFTPKLTYGHCDPGITVDGDDHTVQSTIHADHLFYDDAVSDEPNVSFDLIAAADEDNDNAILQQELQGKNITGEARYQVGSIRDEYGDAIENLWQFVAHQASTVGHINGEGHCEDTIVVP